MKKYIQPAVCLIQTDNELCVGGYSKEAEIWMAPDNRPVSESIDEEELATSFGDPDLWE